MHRLLRLPLDTLLHGTAYGSLHFLIREVDYRMTLRQWFERLVARRDEALRIVDVATYNRYVVFFPAAWRYFDERTGVLFRFLLRKPAA